MSAHLSALQVILLITMACAMAGGQVLFKYAAVQLPLNVPLGSVLMAAASWPMLLALFVYTLAAGLWVYLLRDIPLSRAYPFVALAFALVPIAGWIAFSEPLSMRYWAGLAIMLAGLYVITAAS